MFIRHLLIPLLMGMMVNCGVNSEAQKKMEKQKQTKKEAITIDERGLPEKYVSENYLYRIFYPGDRSSGPNAMAVYEDGAVFRYSDQKMEFDKGNLIAVKVPLEWRLETKIKPSSISNIKHLLDEFSDEKHRTKESKDITEISFYLEGVLDVLSFEGEGSPKNYMIFNKINTEISLGRIMDEEE